MAKIAIDAGHGLTTSGKRCHASLDPKQTREWVLNSRIATELGRLLKNAGHQIKRVDDTDGSTDILLANRVKAANDWGADFYISVHHDAVGNGKVFNGGGTTVYVSVGCSEKSIEAQNAIYKHAMKRAKLPGDNRSNGTRATSFYVIKNTTMPACLIECGFMDSSKDIKYILDEEWAKQMALGIAEGICEVFGGKVNPVKKTPVKEQTKAPVAEKKPAEPKKTETKKEEKKPAKLNENGTWNKSTTIAAQYVLKTVQDGIISNQPMVNKKILLTASTETWKFKEKDYKDGSSMVKALQKLIGAEVDGLFGKESIKALQKFFKKQKLYTGLISGKLNKATTVAFQKYLNKRMGY